MKAASSDDSFLLSRLIEVDPANARRKTIAVSGSRGLVGSQVVRLLNLLGHRVVRLARSPKLSGPSAIRAEASQRPGQAPQAGSVTTGKELDDTLQTGWDPQRGLLDPNELRSVDAVIHLAGLGIGDQRWTPAVKRALWSSRVDATQILATQLSQLPAPPKAFVTSSGIGFYGSCGARELNENDPVGNDFLAGLADAWEEASKPLSKVGCRWSAGRLAIVLSPEGGALAKMLKLFRWGLGGRIGSGRQYWSCIGLEDAAAAFVWLALNPDCAGPYNLVAESVTNVEFTRELAAAVARPAFLPAPAFALRILLGEMADGLLLSSTNAYGNKLRDSGYRFRHPTLREILNSNLGRQR